MNKLAVIVVVAAILIGGWFALRPQKTEAPTGDTATEADQQNGQETAGETQNSAENTDTNSSIATGEVKEFALSAANFRFSESEIRVKRGDRVRIVFTNVEGMHDWVIDEFNSRTDVISAGESQTVEFVADKAGTFEYYCSVGNHRAMGMKGSLIVE